MPRVTLVFHLIQKSKYREDLAEAVLKSARQEGGEEKVTSSVRRLSIRAIATAPSSAISYAVVSGFEWGC